MLNRRIIPQFGFAVVTFIAVGLSGFGFLTFQQNLVALNQASQEDISWPVTQLEVELMRFRDTLQSTNTENPASIREINNRFDVLWSRVGVFQRGKVGARIRQYDQDGMIDRLVDTLQKQEVAIVSLSPNDVPTMVQVGQAFAPFSAELRGLRQRTFVGEGTIAAGFREQMRSSAAFTLWISIISVGFMVLALIYYGWQGRRFKRLAERNHDLACEAQDANRAKSKFLTMMSHELRTPMNGVLGLLALVRQTQVTESQDRLLEQANLSARQMINMLTDILDFSSLEGNNLALENKQFETEKLVETLRDLVAPEVKRAGIEFHVSCTSGCPGYLMGDFVRLRQSFSHLVTYFTETAGTGKIDLVFDYIDGNFIGNIHMQYAPKGEGWTPDLIFGGRSDSSESFAADALGPAVARGLVGNMKGEIRLDQSETGQICVSVSIPLENAGLDPLRVKCDVQSMVMQTLCRSALADSSINFVDDSYTGDINVVMLEAGAADVERQVKQLRISYPKVFIIGIGEAKDRSVFDYVAVMPLHVEALRNTVFGQQL